MLTQEQIDFFHTNGYLIMRGVFQGEELRQLTEAVNVVQAQGVARKGSDHLYLPGPNGQEVYWRSENMWQRGDIFQAVTVQPELLENIGQCIGQAFYPWNDSLVVKLAQQGAAVKWHQDPPYWHKERLGTFAVPNFTTDIYLDHSGPENGCVYAIPGHHLVGNVDLASSEEEELFEQHGALPLEMEAGDVLFHCLSTPHGSRPNTSSTQRRIFYIHYLAEEVYEDGYLSEPWAKLKPGWTPERRAQVEQMIERRVALGYDSPLDRDTLRLTAEGFEFVGEPTTPPRHWRALAAAIPPDVYAAKKTLTY
jgi:ectoine hydroxylase-related dioxygenase (phytanoyl-CoA dioxygenase family)